MDLNKKQVYEIIGKHLGKDATHKVSGFEGVLTSVAYYQTGEVSVAIQPLCINGEYKDVEWFPASSIVWS